MPQFLHLLNGLLSSVLVLVNPKTAMETNIQEQVLIFEVNSETRCGGGGKGGSNTEEVHTDGGTLWHGPSGCPGAPEHQSPAASEMPTKGEELGYLSSNSHQLLVRAILGRADSGTSSQQKLPASMRTVLTSPLG